jgi:glycosyltransferase involved in cell wall biosynthesis
VAERLLLASYHDALADPPARNAAASFARAGFEVTVLHSRGALESAPLPGVVEVDVDGSGPGPRRWLRYVRAMAATIDRLAPSWVVTIMLPPLAALPLRRRFGLVACIYDIPSEPDAGRFDRWLNRLAFRRLRSADVVWSSDALKAGHARALGALSSTPLVCHNCPPLDWLAAERDRRLRERLRREGLALGDEQLLVLRAGAVGEACGIEETLDALADVPEAALLLMGRPEPDYRRALERRIESAGLRRRVAIWDRPSDEDWREALAGADAGHLIHRPGEGARARAFALNSSLSNNRLFQYFAAGLPVIAYDDPRLDPLYAEVPCFAVARDAHLTDDLRAILRRWAADPAERRRLGEVARAAHRRVYHWEHQFAPVLGLVATRQIE